MLTCPNPNSPEFLGAYEKRGASAAYLLEHLANDLNFIKWHGPGQLNFDPESLIIENHKGEMKLLDELLLQYVQLPAEVLSVVDVKDITAVSKYVSQLRSSTMSYTIDNEEFVLHPGTWRGVQDVNQSDQAIRSLRWLKAEEAKGFKELDFWYALHEDVKLQERAFGDRPPVPKDLISGGIPQGFDEFFRRMLRDSAMRRYVRSLGFAERVSSYAADINYLDNLRTIPHESFSREDKNGYRWWFQGIDQRQGIDGKSMALRALEWANKNNRGYEATLLSSLIQKYGDHLERSVVRTTDLLVDTEGVQQFHMKDGEGTIYLSEILQQDSEIYRVLVHELVHTATKHLFEEGANLNADELAFVTRLTELYHLAKSRATDEHYAWYTMRGMDSVEEFVSDLFSNPEFRKATLDITYSEDKSVWQQFVEWVRELFGYGEDHFKDVFDVQQLVTRVSNFQRATNHEFPLHVSYSRTIENSGFDPTNINEDALMKLHKEQMQYYERLKNELWNGSEFYRLKEERISAEVEKLESKLRINKQMIEDGGQLAIFTSYENFLSEGHREIVEIDRKLSYNMMDIAEPSELAFWLKQLTALNVFFEHLQLMVAKNTTLDSILGDEGRTQLSGDLSLIRINIDRLQELFEAHAIGALVPLDSVTDAKWIEKAKTEFRKAQPGKGAIARGRSVKKNLDKRRKFIAEYMKNNREEIEREKHEMIRKSLEHIPREIMLFLGRLFPYQQSTDPIIALSKLYLDQVLGKSRFQYLEVEEVFLPLYDAYLETFTSGAPTSFEELWSPMLEKNAKGKAVGYMLSKYRQGEWETLRIEEMEKLEVLNNLDPKHKDYIDELALADKQAEFYRKNYEREFIDIYYEILDKFGQQLKDEAEVIRRQVAHITGGFAGNWVDPSIYSLPELLYFGKLYAEIDEKNGYAERDNTMFDALKEAGIELKQVENNPRWDSYKKKITEQVTQGYMTREQAMSIHSAMKYTTKKWVPTGIEDADGNIMRTEMRLVTTDKLLPFLSKRIPTVIKGKGLERVTNSNYVKGKRTLRQQWLNPDYDTMLARSKDDVTRKIYEFMMSHFAVYDRARPPAKRLQFMVPNMRKSRYEMWKEADMSTMEKFKTAITEGMRLHQDSIDYGNIEEVGEKRPRLTEDLTGAIYRFAPVFYSSRPKEPEMQSFDLATLFLANAEMSIKRQFHIQASPELEAIRHLMAHKRIVGSNTIRRGDERDREVKDNKNLKLFDLMLEDRLYGIRRSPTQNAKWVEFMDGVQSSASLLYLGFNPIASGQNTIYGRVSTSMETMSGGMISSKGRIAGERAYWANFVPMSTDWYNQRSTARIHQISDLFDGVKDFSSRRNDYGRNTSVRRWLTTDNMIQAHMSGEHYVQHIVFLGVLADTVVMNEKEEYIDAAGKVVDLPSKALTLLEALQQDLDGKLQLNDVVKKIEWNGHIKTWETDLSANRDYGSNEALRFMTERIQGLNTLIHGSYGDTARAEFERYWQFRATMHLRKWMLMGFKRRWITNGDEVKDWFSDFGRGKEFRHSENYEQFWERNITVSDHDLAIANEGMYISVLKYMSAIINSFKESSHHFGDETKVLGRMGYAWESFSDHQRANVKRTLFELIMTMAFSTIGPMLAALAADDDDDSRWNIDAMSGMAFSFWRMSTELGMYYNPIKMLDTLRNPAVSVSYALDIAQLIVQIYNDVTGLHPSRYQSGNRRGQLKLWKKATDVIPGVRGINSLFYMRDKLNYQNLNK